MASAALVLSAASGGRAQTFDLAAGTDVRVRVSAARPPGAGETATLAVELDPRGLPRGAAVTVFDAIDGRLLGSIAPFGARARAAPSIHILALDEAAIAHLRRDADGLALKFRIEDGNGGARARILNVEIRLDRAGG